MDGKYFYVTVDTIFQYVENLRKNQRNYCMFKNLSFLHWYVDLRENCNLVSSKPKKMVWEAYHHAGFQYFRVPKLMIPCASTYKNIDFPIFPTSFGPVIFTKAYILLQEIIASEISAVFFWSWIHVGKCVHGHGTVHTFIINLSTMMISPKPWRTIYSQQRLHPCKSWLHRAKRLTKRP